MMRLDKRNDEIVRLYKECYTLQEIGDKFGVSRERVRQILRSRKVSALAGGASKRAAKRLEGLARRRERRCRERWGISHAEYRHLRSMDKEFKKTPMGLYKKQRQNAVDRGIGWRLSFVEWLSIWEESGHLEARGRAKGQYVMTRIGDVGDYRAGNVRIQTCTENIKEMWEWRRERDGCLAGVET